MPPRRRSSRRWSDSRSQHSGFAAAAVRGGLFSADFGRKSPKERWGKTAYFTVFSAAFWPKYPEKHDKMAISCRVLALNIEAKNKAVRQDFLETESHFRTSYMR